MNVSLVAQLFVMVCLFINYFLVVIFYVCCYSITSRVEAKPDSRKNKMPFFLCCFLLEQPLQVLLCLKGRKSRDFSMLNRVEISRKGECSSRGCV